MILYLLFLFSLFCFSILTEDRTIRKYFNLIFIIFSFLFLLSLITFRGDIKNDTEVYIAYFYDSADSINSLLKNFVYSRHEPGYLTVEFLNKKIINNHVFHFFVIGCMSLIFIFKSLKNYTTYFYLGLSLYFLRFFFLRDLNQIRAGVALAIVLYSIKFISKRDVLPFYLLILMAASFHKTALLIIPFYYINNYIIKNSISNKKLILALILSFCISFIKIKQIIGELIIKYVPSSASYVSGYLSESGNLFSLIVLYQVIVFLTFMLFENQLKNRQPHYYTIRNMLLVSLLLLFIFNDFAILSSRLSTLFATVEIIILPSFVLLFKNKLMMKILYFIFFILLFYINVYKRLGEEYMLYF
ncbi:EpsG family protein [Maribacter forsetii]|uniref:EpsG family protein n=1 Tax=Maribacter forsetii TaxID=444515 RepID=UPI00068C773D|nr:EpsG family protein [Maribacter forsetii]